MPRKPPAEPIDHHYDIPRLNRAFTWTAVVLAVVFIWMVIADYSPGLEDHPAHLHAARPEDLTKKAALAAHQKAIDKEHTRLVADLRASRAEIAQQAGKPERPRRSSRTSTPQSYPPTRQASSPRPPSTRPSTSTRMRSRTSPSGGRGQEGARRRSARSSRREPPAREAQAAGGGGQTEIDLINARQERHREHDREADRRVPADAIQVGRSEAGRALRVPQLADPGHDQPVPARPAGAASRPLQQRQLHADSPRGPLRDLPRRRGPQGIRGPKIRRSSGRTRS